MVCTGRWDSINVQNPATSAGSADEVKEGPIQRLLDADLAGARCSINCGVSITLHKCMDYERRVDLAFAVRGCSISAAIPAVATSAGVVVSVICTIT
jgi:hypothetical protein